MVHRHRSTQSWVQVSLDVNDHDAFEMLDTDICVLSLSFPYYQLHCSPLLLVVSPVLRFQSLKHVTFPEAVDPLESPLLDGKSTPMRFITPQPSFIGVQGPLLVRKGHCLPELRMDLMVQRLVDGMEDIMRRYIHRAVG